MSLSLGYVMGLSPSSRRPSYWTHTVGTRQWSDAAGMRDWLTHHYFDTSRQSSKRPLRRIFPHSKLLSFNLKRGLNAPDDTTAIFKVPSRTSIQDLGGSAHPLNPPFLKSTRPCTS